MKPEFMRLRRALASTLAALLLAVGIVVLSPALSASAHDKTVTANCDNGLSISLTNYPQGTTVTVVVDGANRTSGSQTFSGNWSEKYDWESTVAHTFSVAVVSPDDPQRSRGWTFTKTGSVDACPSPDSPTVTIAGESCVNPSTKGGTITFNLGGVSRTYTVTLNGTSKTTTSTGGTGTFLNVPPGTYTVTATASNGPSATSGPVTLTDCAPAAPLIALSSEPCVTGGSLGAITASLSNLAIGSTYQLKLFASGGAVLETLSLTATAATATQAFAAQGSGTYYATVTAPGGTPVATSANTTIGTCAAELAVTVQLEPCTVFQTGTARAISVELEGMAPSTVYTVSLVTADADETEIATTTTPGDSATTFVHTFTGVPNPGNYKVLVVGGTDSMESDTVAAAKCGLDTLAPPSIELIADQCDGSGTGIDALAARMIDLDASKTYYVRIVDASGATVPGGEDRTVSGSTTATVEFPDVTAAGTYNAQLLIDPGKQLAATSAASIDFALCLPTLAMTGPGALVPLGSVAALLLTLGGAVVMGRLRRRMAL
jgi:hypothetical protein